MTGPEDLLHSVRTALNAKENLKLEGSEKEHENDDPKKVENTFIEDANKKEPSVDKDTKNDQKTKKNKSTKKLTEKDEISDDDNETAPPKRDKI